MCRTLSTAAKPYEALACTLGMLAVAGCVAHSAKNEKSAGSPPELVVTVHGMLQAANSTVFALYASGQMLTSIDDSDRVAPTFYEEWMTPDEHSRFLKNLQLDELLQLAASYSSDVKDADTWVVGTWTEDEKNKVFVDGVGCSPGRESRFVPLLGPMPVPLARVLDQVCAACGRGNLGHLTTSRSSGGRPVATLKRSTSRLNRGRASGVLSCLLRCPLKSRRAMTA